MTTRESAASGLPASLRDRAQLHVDTGYMADPYFADPLGQRRQVLLWAVAARRQLDRWEPLVARYIWSRYDRGTPMPSHQIWEGETEHHFTIVAFDHMLEALKLWSTPVAIPSIVKQEVAEVRDLVTHWQDNMPVFNTRLRKQEPPRRTGRTYAARNPDRTPYSWFSWSARRGPMLTTNVCAPDARKAIHAACDAVLSEDPGLSRFVPPEVPSPWLIDDHGNWWPSQTNDGIQPT